MNVRTIEYRVRWQKDVLNWLLCICPCSFYILDSKFEATRQTVVFVCIGYNIFCHVIFSASSSSPSSWIFVCSFFSRFMLFLLHMYMLHCAHRTHAHTHADTSHWFHKPLKYIFFLLFLNYNVPKINQISFYPFSKQNECAFSVAAHLYLYKSISHWSQMCSKKTFRHEMLLNYTLSVFQMLFEFQGKLKSGINGSLTTVCLFKQSIIKVIFECS